jgi:hypothetical protein
LKLTPEQLELALKLSSIFMPYAEQQRDEALKRQAVGGPGEYLRFAHYTSAEAALAIIKTKRMWLRNATCMSDFSEVQHGFRILNSFFLDDAKKRTFAAALDTCAPGAAGEAIELFNKNWRDIQLDTYIASVSEHDQEEDQHGRLSMWRAFGSGGGARVAIVFKVPMFSVAAIPLNVLFSPVAYLRNDEAHAVIEKVIGNVQKNSDFLRSLDRSIIVQMIFTTFLAAVTCLKHEGFREEREWRAIYSPNRLGSPLMEHSTEVISGVPQIVYKLPLDEKVSTDIADLDFSRVFDQLVIGPTPYSWALFKAFIAALGDAGIRDSHLHVLQSFIPLRV